MTTSLPQAPVETPAIGRGRLDAGWQRAIVILLVLVAIFAATYALAWFDASRLTSRFMEDANASFENGDYLVALMGRREYDPELDENIVYGGYSDVARIWNDSQARPVPDDVALARTRIEEIINERLTLDQAEAFVQRNIGQSNPYLGRVYLRLGELYEEEGDLRAAEDIYEETRDLFRDQPQLIERAEANLARLKQE